MATQMCVNYRFLTSSEMKGHALALPRSCTQTKGSKCLIHDVCVAVLAQHIHKFLCRTISELLHLWMVFWDLVQRSVCDLQAGDLLSRVQAVSQPDPRH